MLAHAHSLKSARATWERAGAGGFRGAARHGIVPDYAARPTVADLIAGRDPAMEKALELARAPLVSEK